ncbi:MAG: YraN family protein, partial [Bacteroidota bacterium]
ENILAIVEVKTRSSIAFGLPQDFVKPKKVKLLVKAVDAYIQNNNLDLEVRFDIIAIHKNGTNLSIEHLEDAFHYF